jgi:hypothetical protein
MGNLEVVSGKFNVVRFCNLCKKFCIRDDDNDDDLCVTNAINKMQLFQ